jgi:16S rRNA (adenine1518-N6/adenine1519-N6)-dimethyltransferase
VPDQITGPDTLPPLREVIARYDIGARRSLGQHFLLDLNLTRRIARDAGPLDGLTVIEIGPGPGGLTRALLESGAREIIAIERDARAVEAMAMLRDAYPGRLTIIEDDALNVSLSSLGDPENPKAVVANLPYNIAQRLLIGWLHEIDAVQSLTLMFQKEVADRLAAPPGSRAYGRLSVITQWLCEVEPLFDVPPSAFVPPPKVTSTVLHLTPRAQPLAPAGFATLERVTASAFGQRRKMLRAALKTLSRNPLALLEEAAIDPTARAETLTVEQFCSLARAYDAATADQYPS